MFRYTHRIFSLATKVFCNSAIIADSIAKGIWSLSIFYSLRVNDVSKASAITTWTSRQELEILFSLARACPIDANALEIGSYLGASTCYLAAGLANTNGKLFCVDTWQNDAMSEGGRDTFEEFQKNIKGVRSKVNIVRKKSNQLQVTDIAIPLSLVFIDGDHEYTAVSDDFSRIANWVSESGIVVFHDCIWFSGVSRVIGEALASGDWVLQGYIDNLCWIKRSPKLRK